MSWRWPACGMACQVPGARERTGCRPAKPRPPPGRSSARSILPELARAFRAATEALLTETGHVDDELAARLSGTLRDLAG